MATLRKFAWIALSLGIIAGSVHGASFSETNAYSGAAQSFQDKNWWLAEAGFARFVQKFPKSEQRAQAVLYQAVARFRQANFAGVTNLLQANLERAGALADEYQFWIAEALFYSTNYTAAVEAYRELWRRYGTSARRIEALVNEAVSQSRLGQWTQVVTLLANPEGEFALAAQSSPTNVFVARGWLLLGDAQLALKNYAGVEAAVAPLIGRKLGDALVDWRAEHLRFEAQLATDRLPEALVSSSNLIALAATAVEDRAELMSESVALQAGVLEKSGRPREAKEVFKRNLAPGTRPERQRQALLRITELALAEGKPMEAASNLVSFLRQSSNSPAADVALFSLGEIHLKQHVASLATNSAAVTAQNTNELEVALGYFDRLVTTFTNSSYLGKAELNRGWCFWMRKQLPESATAFGRAAELLANTEDAVIARFKLGDVFFAQKDFAQALERYRQTAEALPRWPRATEALGVELSYQILRASLEVTNVTAAEEAMAQILKYKPRSDLADRSMLLMVQGLADSGKPELVQGEFEKFVKLAPDSALRPEVELVLGRAREQQADWPGAIAGYDDWLTRFSTNVLRPRVEFQRAWVNYKAGRETNALTQFTNFVARFPTNDLAPQAQWWVAAYFFRMEQYYNAEINYKPIFLNWPTNELALEARLWAGRAAMLGSRYGDAITHFTNLTSTLNRPHILRLQALFAYGEVLMAQKPAGTNRLENYGIANDVFDTILREYPTNATAVLAWIEKAKCYKQMGTTGSESNATFCFSQVVTSPVADAAARSEAQVGIALVILDKAQREPPAAQTPLLRQAFSNLLEVVYGTNLIPGETQALFWVKKAGLEAGALHERLGEWEQAEKLYLRLQDLLPVLRTAFQKKIDQAREHRAAEKPPPPG